MPSVTQPEIRWLEDEPLAEWSEWHGGDRMTNVRPSSPFIASDSWLYSYDPATSPFLRVLTERTNYTKIRRATRWERVVVFRVRRWRRWRRALALRIDPTIRYDLESLDEW